MTEDEELMACAWSDYRKEYGVHADDQIRALQYASFTSGWKAARGTLDIGGVQR